MSGGSSPSPAWQDSDNLRLPSICPGGPRCGYNLFIALEELVTFVDKDLPQYNEIWAAAGTPHAVFKLAPADLVRITGGRVIAIS